MQDMYADIKSRNKLSDHDKAVCSNAESHEIPERPRRR
jgi:hypothetical protein